MTDVLEITQAGETVVLEVETTPDILEVSSPGPAGPKGLRWKGDWAAGDYIVDDLVRDAAGALGANNHYICVTAHTASDLAAESANWELFIDVVAVETAKVAAQSAAVSAADDATATAADRVQTGLDRIQTGADADATAADRVQTGQDVLATAADAIATAADRVATGNDAIATAADRIATAADAAATAADRIQTGLDAPATAADVIAAGTSETNAAASESKAMQWADANQNIEVETGKYSAKHWALEAQATVTGILVYRGSWDASGGVYPTSPAQGDYYKITVAGTISGTVFGVNDSIIYNGTDWDKIDSTDSVASVNGYTGTVVLAKGDVGLGNADNTADANKPVSTAQQAALDLKVAGPASATDNAIARFDGATGKLVQDSRAIIDNGGNTGLGNTLATSHATGGAFAFVDPDAKTIVHTTRLGYDDNAAASVADLQIISYGSNDDTGGGSIRFINSRYASETGLIKSSREGPYAGYMDFYTYSSGLNRAMRIDSSGKVGIGTSVPVAKFDVDASNNSAYIGRFHNSGTTDAKGVQVVVDTTTSANRLLSLHNNAGARFIVYGDGQVEVADDLTVGGGIYLGGTAAANKLDDYEKYTAPSAACTGAITPSVIWKATKTGNHVTLTLPSTSGTATALPSFTYGTALPSAFRPTANLSFMCAINDAGAGLEVPGIIVVNTNGLITVYKDATATANFTAGPGAGLGQGVGTAVSWTI